MNPNNMVLAKHEERVKVSIGDGEVHKRGVMWKVNVLKGVHFKCQVEQKGLKWSETAKCDNTYLLSILDFSPLTPSLTIPDRQSRSVLLMVQEPIQLLCLQWS